MLRKSSPVEEVAVHRPLLSILIALFAGLAVPASAVNEIPKWPSVAKSIAVIGYRLKDGTFAEWGTAFCVESNASQSQFLTDEHVIEQPASSEPIQLVVLLPQNEKPVAATVVRFSKSSDLAIVSIDVGNIPRLQLSAKNPETGDQVTIGGFPYIDGIYGGLTRVSQTIAKSPSLSPSAHLGTVSNLHVGGLLIQFDGNVDRGNSGSPLFDPDTGLVYGVVEGYIPGSPVNPNGDPSVSAAYADMAMSRQAVADFMSGRPDAIGVAPGTVPASATTTVFQVAAAKGDAASQNIVGLMYRNGSDGVQRDYAKALHYFQLAADQGNADAQANLGGAYVLAQGVNQDFATAVHYFQLSANQGNGHGQADLGSMYERGWGVQLDYAQALYWYRLSAAHGNSNGQVGLSYAYFWGHGVPRDYAQAVHWTRLAAAQGDSEAEANLGSAYALGEGVPRDYAQALRWIQLSVVQDNAWGEVALGTCYKLGTGVPQDYALAMHWYRLAVDQDASFGAYVGDLYYLGDGVPKDYAQALRWYSLAAAKDDSGAEVAMGTLYANGQGVPQSYVQALHYYEQAASHDDVDAEVNLGEMYENGVGVSQDFVQALHWYRLAAAQGDADGKAGVLRVSQLLKQSPH